MTKDIQILSAAAFRPYLGQDFLLQFPGGDSTVAQLAEVVEWPTRPGLERQPFSIVLQTGQLQTYYPQAIYTIEHPAWTPLSLFLVPLGVKGNGMQYEAVFS